MIKDNPSLTQEHQGTYMRRGAAAAYLSVSEALLAKFATVGGGPPYSLAGRAAVYARHDLDEWMKSRRRTSTSQAA